MLEDVRAVDSFDGAGRDGKALDDVAILDVFGIVWETAFH
jgi:hypothetical protein